MVTRRLQMADVAGMEKVEHAVAEHDASAPRPLLLERGRQFIEGPDLCVAHQIQARSRHPVGTLSILSRE